MRTETITRSIYTFDELPEDAQQKAIEKLYNINVDYEWWDYVYDNAKNVGLQITEFDLDRNRYAKGKMLLNTESVIYLILENHGEQCETYKTALNYKKQIEPLKNWIEKVDNSNFDLCSRDCVYDTYKDKEDLIEELKEDFLKDILEDYSIMLQKEYEYLSSEEAIKEIIIANEYEFLEDGTLI